MASEAQRLEKDRQRKRRYRQERPTISFVTDRATKRTLQRMAEEGGHQSIKAMMEALAVDYLNRLR